MLWEQINSFTVTTVTIALFQEHLRHATAVLGVCPISLNMFYDVPYDHQLQAVCKRMSTLQPESVVTVVNVCDNSQYPKPHVASDTKCKSHGGRGQNIKILWQHWTWRFRSSRPWCHLVSQQVPTFQRIKVPSSSSVKDLKKMKHYILSNHQELPTQHHSVIRHHIS
jgi:hypothetical protein